MDNNMRWEVRGEGSQTVVATFNYRCDALTFARRASKVAGVWQVKFSNDGAVARYEAGRRVK